MKLTQENILIVLGALALSVALLLPQKISSCPKGKTYDPVLGGSCSLFLDENQDGICDLAYGISAPERSGFSLSSAPEFFAFLSLFIIAITLSLVKSKPKLRYITLSVGLLLGIWSWRRICPLGTLQLLFLQKDKIVLLLLPFLVFLIPVIAALIVGQIFCLWVCPIGALQEFIWRVSRFIIRKPQKGVRPQNNSSLSQITVHLAKHFNTLKYIVVVAVAGGVFYFGEAIFCKVCPFGLIFGCSKISLVYIILLLPIVFCLLTFFFRPFCRYLCPYGVILKFLYKFSFRKGLK